MEGHSTEVPLAGWNHDDSGDDHCRLDLESNSENDDCSRSSISDDCIDSGSMDDSNSSRSCQNSSCSSLSNDWRMNYSTNETSEEEDNGEETRDENNLCLNSRSNNYNNMANYAADVLPPMSPAMLARSTTPRRNYQRSNNHLHHHIESAGLLLNATPATSSLYQRRNSSSHPSSSYHQYGRTNLDGNGATRPRAQTWSNQTTMNCRNGPPTTTSSSTSSTPIRSNNNNRHETTNIAFHHHHHYSSQLHSTNHNLVFPTLHNHDHHANFEEQHNHNHTGYIPPRQQLAPRFSSNPATTQQLLYSAQHPTTHTTANHNDDDVEEVELDSDIMTTDEETASLTTDTFSGGSDDDNGDQQNVSSSPPRIFRRASSSLSSSLANNNTGPILQLHHHHHAPYPRQYHQSHLTKMLRVSLVMSCYVLVFLNPSSSRSYRYSFLANTLFQPNNNSSGGGSPSHASSSSTTIGASSSMKNANNDNKKKEPELPVPGHGREIEFPLFGGKHHFPTFAQQQDQTSNQVTSTTDTATTKEQQLPKAILKKRPSLSHARTIHGSGAMPMFGSTQQQQKRFELHEPSLDSSSSLLSSSSVLSATITGASSSSSSSNTKMTMERFVLPSDSSDDIASIGTAGREQENDNNLGANQNIHMKHHDKNGSHNDDSSSFLSECLWWFAFGVTLFSIIYLTLMDDSTTSMTRTMITHSNSGGTGASLRQQCQRRFRLLRMYISRTFVWGSSIGGRSRNTYSSNHANNTIHTNNNNTTNSHRAE